MAYGISTPGIGYLQVKKWPQSYITIMWCIGKYKSPGETLVSQCLVQQDR